MPYKQFKKFWIYLDTLCRQDVVNMAVEEILDVRGLSKVQSILRKYNLSHVTIDYKLNCVFKKGTNYNYRKDVLKEEEEQAGKIKHNPVSRVL